MKKKPTASTAAKKNKIWHIRIPKALLLKISSGIIVAIFIIIIIAGLISDYYPRRNPTVVVQDETLLAKTLVASALEDVGDSITNYQFETSKQIRHFEKDNKAPNVIQVCLNNSVSRQIYIIDVDSKTILMHSEIVVYTSGADLNYYGRYAELNSCRAKN